jgi:hypothetical protein
MRQFECERIKYDNILTGKTNPLTFIPIIAVNVYVYCIHMITINCPGCDLTGAEGKSLLPLHCTTQHPYHFMDHPSFLLAIIHSTWKSFEPNTITIPFIEIADRGISIRTPSIQLVRYIKFVQFPTFYFNIQMKFCFKLHPTRLNCIESPLIFFIRVTFSTT